MQRGLLFCTVGDHEAASARCLPLKYVEKDKFIKLRHIYVIKMSVLC